jgi:hypothetical protein
MDNFMQLNPGKSRKSNQRREILPPSRISVARIEKLKKTFQPFWMREMLAHQNGEQNSLNSSNALNQI